MCVTTKFWPGQASSKFTSQPWRLCPSISNVFEGIVNQYPKSLLNYFYSLFRIQPNKFLQLDSLRSVFSESLPSLCHLVLFARKLLLLKASQLDRTRRASEQARRSFLRRAPKHPKLRSCNFAVARSLCGRSACQATLLEFSQGKLHRADSQTHRGTRTRDPFHNSQGCGG